jgi:hypothetical protein
MQLMDALSMILAERERQIKQEGFDAAHDDGHANGELLMAATVYLWWGTPKAAPLDENGRPIGWPWDAKWWKPRDRKRNLVRAGALCRAEIERRKRMHYPLDIACAKLNLVIRELENLAAGEPFSRDQRQRAVFEWCCAAFTEEQATSLSQRGLRLAEEAIEACQACGTDPDKLHKLIDYVYGRPAGTIEQELGGIGVTTLALAAAAGLSAKECEISEVKRVLSKETSHFAARNQIKNDAGFADYQPSAVISSKS